MRKGEEILYYVAYYSVVGVEMRYAIRIRPLMPKYSIKNDEKIFYYEFPSKVFTIIHDSNSDTPELTNEILALIHSLRNYLTFCLDLPMILKEEVSDMATENKIYNIIDPIAKIEYLSSPVSGRIEDIVNSGYDALQRMMDEDSLDYLLWAAIHWYFKGIYPGDSIDRYLHFWRPIETISLIEIDHMKKEIQSLIKSSAFREESKEYKTLAEVMDNLDYMKDKEKYPWIVTRYNLRISHEEIIRFYEIRCKIAHGNIDKLDDRFMFPEIKKLRRIIHNLLTIFIQRKFSITIPSYPSLDVLEEYRQRIYFYIDTHSTSYLKLESADGMSSVTYSH